MFRFLSFVFILILVISIFQFVLVGDVSITSFTDVLSYISEISKGEWINNVTSTINSWYVNTADYILSQVQNIPVVSTLATVFIDLLKMCSFIASGVMYLVNFVVRIFVPLFT